MDAAAGDDPALRRRPSELTTASIRDVDVLWGEIVATVEIRLPSVELATSSLGVMLCRA